MFDGPYPVFIIIYQVTLIMNDICLKQINLLFKKLIALYILQYKTYKLVGRHLDPITKK